MIAGSHDSGTAHMTKDSDFGPDNPILILILEEIFGASNPLVKKIMYNWSVSFYDNQQELSTGYMYINYKYLWYVLCLMCFIQITQKLDLVGQLEAGVRYFDLRVAANSFDENKLYFVHGLFAAEVRDSILFYY